jgi:serine/threonine-protein kinase
MDESLGTMRTMAGGASVAGSAGVLQPGQTLGHYVVKQLIGRGGMGEVYLAEHASLSTRHALKIILPAFSRTPGFEERFLREARLMAILRHPHIVHCTDWRTAG